MGNLASFTIGHWSSAVFRWVESEIISSVDIVGECQVIDTFGVNSLLGFWFIVVDDLVMSFNHFFNLFRNDFVAMFFQVLEFFCSEPTLQLCKTYESEFPIPTIRANIPTICKTGVFVRFRTS